MFDGSLQPPSAREAPVRLTLVPLARQFVEAHGGSIKLVSEPGQGTAVTIELPRT